MDVASIARRRVVLFDFDGTLANTKDAIVETATRALAERGFVDVDRSDVERLIGPPFPEAFCLVFGLSADEAAQVTDCYRRIYSTLGAEAWPLFDGIKDMVARLRETGKTVCVASSKIQPVLERALRDEDMSEAFDLVVGKPTDDPYSKEQTIRRALDLLGATVDEAVMVGDRKYDVEGALACGVPCVGVTYGSTGDFAELSGAGACCVVHSVKDLADVLCGVMVSKDGRGVEE